MPSYDQHGFLIDVPIRDRTTDVPAPDPSGWPTGQRPNWTGHAWVFLDYPPPVPPAPRQPIPASEFRDRFTDTEMAAVVTLAYAGAGDAVAAMLLLKLQTSTEIDLDSQAVIDGLNYLVAHAVLAPERPAEILA